jgi:SAM-dependent methyltransferase
MNLKTKLTNLLNYSRLRLAINQGSILYVGDIPRKPEYANCFGLSLSQNNINHIKHDITKRIPLPDSSVQIVQSEDVFEHIEPMLLVEIINDIHRILKPGGIFRLSMPDYRCDFLHDRSIKDEQGTILFDPGGGGVLLS